MTLSALMDEFGKPGSAYRGAPFWAWNGKLEPEELRRQIRLMHRMGLGGFFMHSRVGLDTAYLSDEWFECVDACIDEAEKLDMQAWLYDEDRWPSGAAGGLVTQDPQYRMRSLVAREAEKPAELKWDKDTLAAFVVRTDGERMAGYKRVARGKKPGALDKGERLFVFRVEPQRCSSWYNGYTYLDTMSHEAVAKFIETTHEAYVKHLGKKLGKRVPGIFTDEPNHGPVMPARPGDAIENRMPEGGLAAPWTPKMAETFKQRYGYDLLDHLPEVYLDTTEHEISRVRYHYHDCKTFLFVDAFARQIGEWCEKNKCLHTGHCLSESPIASQMNVTGSAMRFYEHMQAPGMDLLRQFNREYDTARGVSSVAHQFGRRWRLTETYGCTGWDFPFAGHKALGDWQAALGINLRCQHLAWYTMEGQAKRDYPAAIFYQSPWWDLYPKVEDYFARVHAAMSRGSEVRDLLVIHPNESFWPLMRHGWQSRPEIKKLDRQTIRLRDALLAENLDFDYGDEDILSRHAKIGKTGGGTATIAVGQARYKAVVVPPVVTLRHSTLELLRHFSEQGGTVVFVGGLPKYVDAVFSVEAVALGRHCHRAPLQADKLAQILSPVCRRVSITDGRGRQIEPALYQLRDDGDASYLFVVNTGHNFGETCNGETRDVAVAKRTASFARVIIRGFEGCAGAPIEMDCETGATYAANAQREGDGWVIETSLPALGSRLFAAPHKAGGKAPAPRPALKNVRTVSLGGAWSYALSEANCLVLDKPAFQIGEGAVQTADEILRVDHAVRDALGIARRGGQMVQPWARTRSKSPKCVAVTLGYSFEAESLPTGDLFLAIERPETFRIEINGTALDGDMVCGWWVDRSLRTLRVDPACIRKGLNEIRMVCDYDENHPGLEMVYLLGNFGTRVKGTQVTMTALPAQLTPGDWTRQGLGFYSGSVAYTRTVKTSLSKGQRLFVEVPDYQGIAVRVRVNGKAAGVIAWAPNELDVTELIEGERSDITLEVVGHRRNSHGPLHHAMKQPPWVGPGEYVTTGDRWSDDYQLVPVGLMAPAKLVVKS